MRVAIYCRVSTDQQELEQQVKKCMDYCSIRDWKDFDTFTEIKSAKEYRPVWQDVLQKCRESQYSHLVVFRIDRAWRRARDFIMDFDDLQSHGIIIVSVMEGLDPSTSVGKAMMTMVVVMAELERSFISEATKQRLDALRNQGKKLGRKPGRKDSPNVVRPKGNYYLAWQKRKQRYGKTGSRKSTVKPSTVDG